MTKPSSKLQTHRVYSHQTDGKKVTVADVDWVRLTTREDGTPADDPGAVALTLSDANDAKDIVVEPEDAVEIGSALITAAQMAIEARKRGGVPDGVPAEWTEGSV